MERERRESDSDVDAYRCIYEGKHGGWVTVIDKGRERGGYKGRTQKSEQSEDGGRDGSEKFGVDVYIIAMLVISTSPLSMMETPPRIVI